ncbi:polysaccharide pyruvyl transferase family protein [Oceanobacillus chungangensis]|uniref:Polysaccharide pyruvyl transferase family protein n=1 Tax=Oceanobacillus chungangensis TaxID=1229152 RepID=A0A3D8PXB1_9BACI|nr:polysaccharide pyruvyl transferase family protein [Oceanobacillus chungangensis]RDW20412.1 polysaccharide pyruvyl transferase family protein [Oceanobacillus chungangensis]
MDNILILDTSVGSLNKGDDIIMKCIKSQLLEITKNSYVLTLPTHVSPFHWYQVARRSSRLNIYSNAKYKFVGGSNLLTMDMLTHFPQWNINMFNYGPLTGSILVGVGAGKGNKINRYTKMLYKKVLSHEFIHSVRDERTKIMLEEMGFEAINTGCATLWSLTPELCNDIPTKKSESVVFTLTPNTNGSKQDQLFLDILNLNYKYIYFWIQGIDDLSYLKGFKNIENIRIIPPTIEDYEKLLSTDVDYIGTRLHGGIFAMRHRKRSIIISIDERARGMGETYNLNLVDREDIHNLDNMINSDFVTDIRLDFGLVEKWLNQFEPQQSSEIILNARGVI